MKTIKLIGVFVVLMFLVGCTTMPVQLDTTTIPGTLGDMLIVYDEWEGLLNPHDFRDWRILGHRPCPEGYQDYHVLLQNPEGEPDTVELILAPHENKKQFVLIWYRYRTDRVIYLFSITIQNKEKYTQIQPKEV